MRAGKDQQLFTVFNTDQVRYDHRWIQGDLLNRGGG